MVILKQMNSHIYAFWEAQNVRILLHGTVGSSEYVAGVYEESSTHVHTKRLYRCHVPQWVFLCLLAMDDLRSIHGWGKKKDFFLYGKIQFDLPFSHIHSRWNKNEEE